MPRAPPGANGAGAGQSRGADVGEPQNCPAPSLRAAKHSPCAVIAWSAAAMSRWRKPAGPEGRPSRAEPALFAHLAPLLEY